MDEYGRFCMQNLMIEQELIKNKLLMSFFSKDEVMTWQRS